MIYQTCFSSVCASGYSISLVKSALQKFLRRRMPCEMKWCVQELFKFHSMAANESQQKIAKAILTNLLNRLIIMCDEELLFAEMNKYRYVRSLIHSFQLDFNIHHLYQVCDCLCQSRLLRCGSDVACYFLAQDLSPRFNPGNLIRTLEQKMNAFTAAFLKCRKNPEDVKAYETVFYWAFDLFLNKSEWKIKPLFRRSHPVYHIWDFLLKNSTHSIVLEKCLEYRLEEFHKERNEKKLFLVSAIHMSLFGCQNMDSSFIPQTDSPLLDVEKLEIPDYCIDMHCKEGRKAGKNESDFALEGSLVVQEDQQFLNSKYRQFYLQCKFKASSSKKRKEKEEKEEEKVVEKEEEIVVAEEKKEVKLFPIFYPQKKSKVVEEKEEKEENVCPPNPFLRHIRFIADRPLDTSLPFRSMDEFEFVRLCSKNPCGNKVMCFVVRDLIDQKMYVLKEGRKSMAYNEDCGLVDALKPVFGLQSIGGPGTNGHMIRIFSDKVMRKLDTSLKSWENNWFFEEPKERPVYLMMNYLDGCQSMVQARHAKVLGEEQIQEFIKIGLFRGICLPSDFSEHNVLECNGQLTSIDEHDIFGKRLRIIGIRHQKLFQEKVDVVRKVLKDWMENAEVKIEDIKSILESSGCFSKQKAELEEAILYHYTHLEQMIAFEINMEK